MILVVDNFDSFTYNLVDFMRQLGLVVEVKRNNAPLIELLDTKYDAVILSPGPGVPEKAGNLMKIIDYLHDKKPILGICLGHQAIGEFFLGKVVRAEKPMHGKISQISHKNDPIFNNVPVRFNVVRYHSLICSNLPDQLEIIAQTNTQEIMAMRHTALPIYGLQFHPEAILTNHGLEILRNWRNINSLSN